MTYNPQTDDDLLRGVLYRADDASLGEDTDAADELLALFMEGQLKGDDRAAFFHYLDTHPESRRAVGHCAKYIGHQPAVTPAPARVAKHMQSGTLGWLAAGLDRLRQFVAAVPRWGRTFVEETFQPSHIGQSWGGGGTMAGGRYFSRTAFAMATMLLLATTATLWFAWQPLAREGLLAELDDRGRLSPAAFGISLNREKETTAMSADAENKSDSMQVLLDTFPDTEEGNQLREAYDFLDRNQLDLARSAFAKIIDKDLKSDDDPKSYYRYYALLGQGNSWFLGKRPDDYIKAEDAYRRALQLHDDSNSARIGLAMALSRQKGKSVEAFEEWKKVKEVAERLPKAWREDINGEMERLKKLSPN